MSRPHSNHGRMHHPAVLALLLVALLSMTPAWPISLHAQGVPDTTTWTVVMGGRHAGVYQRWREADGEIRYFFEFNDRGRGPQLESRVRVDESGAPLWVEATGVDYFKAPMTASLDVRNERARWEARGDSGVVPVRASVYFADAGIDDGMIIRAALAAGGQLQAIPEGTLRVRRVGEMVVSVGDRRQPLVQYEIAGMGFEPSITWLTPEGEYFGSGSAWFATVPRGWEEVVPQLVATQEQREGERYAEIAKRIARRPAQPLVFRNVNVFDAEHRMILRGQTVVVSGNRITEVGSVRRVRVPRNAQVIDGAGRTLLPGLWDMHAHASALRGVMHVAGGVTTARDLGNDTAQVLDLQRKWNANTTVGPRLLVSGFIDGPGQYTGPIGIKVSTEEEARAAVDQFARQGMVQVKVYSSLEPALLRPIIEQARRHGMRVSGHIPWPMLAEEAVRQGIDELQHANFLLLNFLGDTIDTRTPQRFHAPARMGADIDISSKRVREFVQLLKERDVVVDPTLGVFEGMFTGRPGQVSPGDQAIIDRMPPQVRQNMRGGGLPVPEGMDERYRTSHRRMIEFVGLLHREGVRIVPGTDGWPGFLLHRELELYTEAGIPAAEVLYLATLGSARVMRQDDRLGSIEPGKLADLVLVEGDPTVRISDIRQTRLVVKDGIVFDPNALYAEISVGPVP